MPTKVTRELRLVPPKVYDHPYVGPGVLRVIYAKSQDEVRQLCPRTLFPKAGACRCAPTNSEGCVVVVRARRPTSRRSGHGCRFVIRHEIAHCNGWAGDHRWRAPGRGLGGHGEFGRCAQQASAATYRAAACVAALRASNPKTVSVVTHQSIGI